MKFEPKKCNYCETLIAFVRTVEGKIVPVDIEAPVYRVSTINASAKRIHNKGDVRAYVNHWKTCAGREQAAADRDAKKKTAKKKTKRKSTKTK